MSNWVYLENQEIKETYGALPANWKNISNFFALENDIAFLKSLGWYKCIIVQPTLDTATQKIGDPIYTFNGDVVTKTFEILPKPQPSQEEINNQLRDIWRGIRIERDRRMAEFEWRYNRYFRQTRLGLTTTDQLSALDTYMQSLADITNQSDPNNIIWPEFQG